MQILKTMNDDELVALLGYVAKVADKYERDGLGHHKYRQPFLQLLILQATKSANSLR
jgi:hypothetical protein